MSSSPKNARDLGNVFVQACLFNNSCIIHISNFVMSKFGQFKATANGIAFSPNSWLIFNKMWLTIHSAYVKKEKGDACELPLTTEDGLTEVDVVQSETGNLIVITKIHDKKRILLTIGQFCRLINLRFAVYQLMVERMEEASLQPPPSKPYIPTEAPLVPSPRPRMTSAVQTGPRTSATQTSERPVYCVECRDNVADCDCGTMQRRTTNLPPLMT